MQDILRLPAFLGDLMFSVSRKNRNIIAHRNFRQIWSTHEKDYNCKLVENEILTANLRIYSLAGNVVYEHEGYKNYHYELLDETNTISVWKTIDEANEMILYHIFNTRNRIFVKENLTSKIPLLLVGKTFFICRDGYSEISVFNFKKEKVLWQQDLSELASYMDLEGNESGKIRAVYHYKNSIVVLTQLFVFRIDIKTGRFIYKKQLPAGLMTLSIHENKAYGCYGYHFIALDLDTSEVLSFHRLEFENYEGKQHFAIMNQPVYHEGLVYHGLRLEGGLHCIGAFSPEIGKRVWIHPAGVYNIESIAFHHNRLFIHDAGSNLHVFERSDEKAKEDIIK